MTVAGGGVLLGPRRRQRGQGGRVLRLDGRARSTRSLGRRRTRPLFRAVYGVTGRRTSRRKLYILRLPKPLAEMAKEQKLTEDELLAKLAPLQGEAARRSAAKRPRPFLDTKVLTAWNGQMIAGLRGRRAGVQGPGVHEGRGAGGRVRPQTCGPRTAGCCAPTAAGPGEKAEAQLHRATWTTTPSSSTACSSLHDATGDDRWLTEAGRSPTR